LEDVEAMASKEEAETAGLCSSLAEEAELGPLEDP